jgi:molecular chaperone DnaK (HSP70)
MDENHKRVLGSSLLIIERRLRQIGQDLQQTGEEADSVLQSTINDIDPETRRRMIDVVTSMLDEINQIKELFNLEVAHKSLRWHITATLSEIWNILADLKPEKVSRAFGQMPDDVQEAWRPHISRLSNMLDDLFRELG